MKGVRIMLNKNMYVIFDGNKAVSFAKKQSLSEKMADMKRFAIGNVIARNISDIIKNPDGDIVALVEEVLGIYSFSYSDLYIDDNKLGIDIECGDWKHSHRFLDNLMSSFFGLYGDEVTTAVDGSDCYSAIHYYPLDSKKEEEPISFVGLKLPHTALSDSDLTEHLAMNGYTYETNGEDVLFVFDGELEYVKTILEDRGIEYDVL